MPVPDAPDLAALSQSALSQSSLSPPPLDPRRTRGGWLQWRSATGLSAAAGLLVFGLALPALAEGAGEGAGTKTSLESQVEERLAEMPSGEEGVNQILSELDARLSLSAEQKKDVREVVAQGVAELEKLSARFKSGELTAMALGVQIQMKMQKLAVLIEPLLDPDQQKEYATMRQEQRREMMQAMRKQRTQPAGAK
jgi:hypothetical protein